MGETQVFSKVCTCFLCGGSNLDEILTLPNICLTGYFPKIEEPDPASTPVSIWRCTDCDSVQAGELVNQDLMFDDYWYRSGTTASMVNHLSAIVNQNKTDCNSWLDIGSNDGTLLGVVQTVAGPKVVAGVEPSKAFFDCSEDIRKSCVNDFFGTDDCMKSLSKISPQFDVISAISMFYDVAMPVDFLSKIKSILAPTGRALIEVNYAKSFFSRGNVDMLGQEHLIYYFISTFESTANKAGLHLNDAYLTDMNGGNITFTLTNIAGSSARLDLLKREEDEWFVQFDFERFGSLTTDGFVRLKRHIAFLRSNKKSVKILGASTRGALIAQWLRFTPLEIDSAVDLQPNKKGRKVPGTGIPIELDGEADSPDVYLVMPYQFIDEILGRYSDFMARGGELLFYRPEMGTFKWGGNEPVFEAL